MTYDWRPPHAYVPGQTPRHDEALFDPFKVMPNTPDATNLAASDAWRLGQVLAREGFYWEAHELWEAVWMACPPGGADKIAVQGAIQMVNAALKRRMGQDRAVDRLVEKACRLLQEAQRRHALLVLDPSDAHALRQAADSAS